MLGGSGRSRGLPPLFQHQPTLRLARDIGYDDDAGRRRTLSAGRPGRGGLRHPRLAPVLAATALVFACRSGAAEPEWSTGLVAGAIVRGQHSDWDTHFYGAARGDALFFRTSRHAIGFGPALEVGTSGFSDVRLLGGPELLAPIGELFAVTVSPAMTVRSSSVGAVPGIAARAFFGLRAYGYTDYALNAGLLFGVDHDLGGPREHALVIAAQVDGLVLALPVLFLVSLFHGSSD